MSNDGTNYRVDRVNQRRVPYGMRKSAIMLLNVRKDCNMSDFISASIAVIFWVILWAGAFYLLFKWTDRILPPVPRNKYFIVSDKGHRSDAYDTYREAALEADILNAAAKKSVVYVVLTERY